MYMQADESQQSMLVAGSSLGGLQAFTALTGAAVWRAPDSHDGCGCVILVSSTSCWGYSCNSSGF